MKRIFLSAVFIVICTSTLLAQSPAATTNVKSLTDRVDEIFAQWNKPDSPGCALGVIKDGQLIYKRGYGSANLEYNALLSSESVFYIASTSKQFTAASILLLARRGVIALEDDVRKYVPELPRYESVITINHLVHHISGLRDYLELMGIAGRSFEDNFGNDEAVEMIARQKGLNFKPGEKYLYSNSNYVLLAEIVKRASGKSLREFAAENIFRPLSMNNTHFDDDRTMIVKNRVVSYGPGKSGLRHFIKNINAVGDGNLLTTIEDLALWDQNFYSDKIGGAGFSQQMLTKGKLNNREEIFYGFGLGNEEYKGLKTVAHAGGFLGFRTQLIRFPEQKFSVICLCNSASINPVALAGKVADIYLADQLKPAPVKPNENRPAANTPGQPLTLSETQLAEYAGSFYSDELDATFRLMVENGKLTIRVRNVSRGTLTASNKDEFALLGGRYVFSRDSQGRINGFTLNGGRATGLHFEKKMN